MLRPYSSNTIMLTRLIYVSRALSPLPLDLKDILASARKNNAPQELTGALCFLNGVYMQYLEGKEALIDSLYLRIRDDRRHRQVRLLERRHIDERSFPAWSMALITWNDEIRTLFEKHSPGEKLDLHATDPGTAVKMFHEFARTSNWIVA